MTNTQGINFIYNYPAKAHADLSISTTVCQQASHAAAAHQLLLGWPETPFSDEQLKEFAGDEPDGRFVPVVGSVPKQQVGRNEPCPCGSGRKSKKCHGT